MKNIKYSLAMIGFLGFFLINIQSCAVDKVIAPCGDDVRLNITAQYDRNCDDNCDLPARGAALYIRRHNEVIDSMALDAQGQGYYTIPESGCGIPEGYSLAVAFGNYFHLLQLPYECDTTLINICLTCDSVLEVNCAEIAGTVSDSVRFLEYTGDTCITINTPMSDISNNSAGLGYDGSQNLRINVNSLLNYSRGKFSYADMYPAHDGGFVTLGFKEKIKVFFELQTDEIGHYTDSIDLPLQCVDNNGTVTSTGMWRIYLVADVCPVACDCPFTLSTDIDSDNDFGRQIVGTEVFDDFVIFELQKGEIADGCSLELIDIVRLDGSRSEVADPANTIPSPKDSIYDFRIIMPALPLQTPEIVKVGDDMIVRAGFLPQNTNKSKDTFRLKFNVVSNGAVQSHNCTYDFILEGNGCTNECPHIYMAERLSGDRVVMRNSQTNVIVKQDFLVGSDTLLYPEQNRNEIDISYNLNFKTPCDIDSVAVHGFRIAYPEDIVLCDVSDKEFRVSSRFTNNYLQSEYDMFDYYINGSPGEEYYAEFEFTPPTKLIYEELQLRGLVSNDGIINASFEIRSDDGQCHQIVNFEVRLESVYYVLSPVWHLEAFSQITTKKSNPDYMTCKINQLRDGYWGADKNNPPSVANGNVPNSDDSFFFNVDEPQNTSLIGQQPKLFLVPTSSNDFNKILATPVAIYATEDEFQNDLRALVDDIAETNMNQRGSAGSNIQFSRSLQGWDTNPSSKRDNSEFNNPIQNKGIDINPGEVYLVWDDRAIEQANSETYYCTVALIFIKSVDDGSGPGDVNDVAVTGYRVVYPIVLSTNP